MKVPHFIIITWDSKCAVESNKGLDVVLKGQVPIVLALEISGKHAAHKEGGD